MFGRYIHIFFISPASPRPNKEWSLDPREDFPTTNGQSLVDLDFLAICFLAGFNALEKLGTDPQTLKNSCWPSPRCWCACGGSVSWRVWGAMAKLRGHGSSSFSLSKGPNEQWQGAPSCLGYILSVFHGDFLGHPTITRWWFQIFFVHPYLGRWPNLTIFSKGLKPPTTSR